MGIFNKSEKDDDFGKLYNYLSLKKYPYINQALEYYKLALNGYGGFCFKRNKEVILSVIYIISENLSDSTFKEQIDFAERLYVLLDTDENIYLNNLQVCLVNSTLIYNFKDYLDIYLLFENKLMVSQIICYLNDNKNKELIIDYIKKARKYYVDEEAFYSAILNVILNDELNEKVINEELEIDAWNAGVYSEDIRKLIKK